MRHHSCVPYFCNCAITMNIGPMKYNRCCWSFYGLWTEAIQIPGCSDDRVWGVLTLIRLWIYYASLNPRLEEFMVHTVPKYTYMQGTLETSAKTIILVIVLQTPWSNLIWYLCTTQFSKPYCKLQQYRWLLSVVRISNYIAWVKHLKNYT